MPDPDLALLLRSPALLVALELAWVAGVAVWLVLERRSPTATLAWILALAAIPVLGVPVYLLLGPRRLRRKRVRMALVRHACERYLDDFERGAADTPREQLLGLVRRVGMAPPETARSLTLYSDGDLCAAAMLSAVAQARHHVHAEYYMFRADRTGRRLRDALVERARAGVQVRLLVDAAGSAALPSGFFAPLLEAGGRVQRFNPLLLGRLRRPVPNFRTHRKIVVCDGRVGFTGGMNACDDASASARGAQAWRDTYLRLEGAAVHGLQLTFLENWSFAERPDGTVSRVLIEQRRDYFPTAEPGRHLVQVVSSGPDHEPYAIHALYFAAIAGARRRVWLTTPYFVPDEAMLAALESAAWRGVDVQLVVPSATDSRLVDAAGWTYHDALLEAGVRVHLYGPPMVHAKTCVVDDDLAIVGTANLDNRSFRLNFELVVAMHDAEAAGELGRLFEADVARCRPRQRGEGGGLRRRLVTSAARLLAPQL